MVRVHLGDLLWQCRRLLCFLDDTMDKPGSLRDCQMTLLSRKVQDLTSAYRLTAMKLFNTESALNNVLDRLLYLEDKQQTLFRMQKLSTSSTASTSSSSYTSNVKTGHTTESILEELEGVVDTTKNVHDIDNNNNNNNNNNNDGTLIESASLLTEMDVVDRSTATTAMGNETQPQQQQQQPPTPPSETEDHKSIVGVVTTVDGTIVDVVPMKKSVDPLGVVDDSSLALEPPLSTTPPLIHNLALVTEPTYLDLVSEPLSPPAIASPPPPRIHTYQQSKQLPFEAIPTNVVADARDFAVDAVSVSFLIIHNIKPSYQTILT